MDSGRTNSSEDGQETQTSDVSGFIAQPGTATEDNLVAIPTEVGQSAAEEVLGKIHERSFSGRHPELGKMIKCQIHGFRHRLNEFKCEQKFATGRYDLRNPKPLLIAGQTPETKPVPPPIGFNRGLKVILGAAVFAKKRINRHWNKRQLQFVELVQSLVPDEFTEEELKKARTRARRVLAKKHGRHGFLPSLGQSLKETRERKAKEMGGEQAIQAS